MAGCPAVRMKQWIGCLRETLCLIQMFIVIIAMGIMERGITIQMDTIVDRISTAVQVIEAVNKTAVCRSEETIRQGSCRSKA